MSAKLSGQLSLSEDSILGMEEQENNCRTSLMLGFHSS